jgi:hypothetical protein
MGRVSHFFFPIWALEKGCGVMALDFGSKEQNLVSNDAFKS